MEQSLSKLIKISIRLTFDGYKEFKTEWNVKEGSKVYILTRPDEDIYENSKIITRRLPKEDLMKLDSIFNTSTNFIEYNTICPLESVEISRNIIKEKIKADVLKHKENIDKLLQYV